MNPSKAELKISRPVEFAISFIFFSETRIANNTRADVSEAIVSIGSISSSLRQILKAVGIVDQKIPPGGQKDMTDGIFPFLI
jgi:hypothetical protein